MTNRLIASALVLWSTGCVLDEDPTDLDTDVLELTDAPETDEVPWTVWLMMPSGTGCTGIALTDHWIITAAHCVDDEGGSASSGMVVQTEDASGTMYNVYSGGAQFFPHPDYDEGWLSGVDGEDDIGLIYLQGSGMSDNLRGEIYFDDRKPWLDPRPYTHGEFPLSPGPDQLMHAIGYGRGSDPGGAGCSSSGGGLTVGVKRIVEDNELAQTRNKEKAMTWNDDHHICFGDSGGPWFLPRGGRRLAFAVNSYMKDFLWDETAYATLIAPKWTWIMNTAAGAGMRLECNDYYAGSYKYRKCEDDPVFVWLDAEFGSLAWPMRVGNDGRASQAKYIHVPNGAGSGGSMSYTFSVPREGEYRIWGRVKAASSADDSFFVSIDGGAEVYWDLPTASSWVWDKVNDYPAVDPMVFYLTPGSHTIQVRRREDGPQLDRLLITSVHDFRPWDIWLEAEAGSLTWPMRSTLGIGGNFIWVPNGGGTGGAAVYSIGLPQAGHWHIWGRVRAPSGGDDSFFLQVDDGLELLWDTQQNGSDFSWDRVSHRGHGDATFKLSGGIHTLLLGQREDGTGLDKFLITNDTGFVPKDVGLVVGGFGGFGGFGGSKIAP